MDDAPRDALRVDREAGSLAETLIGRHRPTRDSPGVRQSAEREAIRAPEGTST